MENHVPSYTRKDLVLSREADDQADRCQRRAFKWRAQTVYEETRAATGPEVRAGNAP